jgi:hypothetical protein
MSVMTVDSVSVPLERDAKPEPATPEVTPRGLAFSAILHGSIIVLILFGLPALFRRPPPPETPIAVHLVMIAPETRATQPNPYKPKPEAKPEPPVAAPAPKPEPKPEPPPPAAEPPSAASPPPPPPTPKPEASVPPAPPPPPPPSPKPVEAKAPTPPPRPPEPKPKPEQHAQAAPRPKADPAAFDKLMKTLEHKPAEKRQEPADFDALLKNLTKEQTVQSDEPPRPRPKVMAAGPASSQPKAPLGSQLTASENDFLVNLIKQQLVPCWNVPAGARDAKELSVRIRASVNLDGTVRTAAIVDQGRMNDPLIRAAAESARRTFFNPQCTPLKLPADKYEVWKDLDVTFDPRDLL